MQHLVGHAVGRHPEDRAGFAGPPAVRRAVEQAVRALHEGRARKAAVGTVREGVQHLEARAVRGQPVHRAATSRAAVRGRTVEQAVGLAQDDARVRTAAVGGGVEAVERREGLAVGGEMEDRAAAVGAARRSRAVEGAVGGQEQLADRRAAIVGAREVVQRGEKLSIAKDRALAAGAPSGGRAVERAVRALDQRRRGRGVVHEEVVDHAEPRAFHGKLEERAFARAAPARRDAVEEAAVRAQDQRGRGTAAVGAGKDVLGRGHGRGAVRRQ